MKKNEIIYAKKQRDNVSFLKIHKMLVSDLLFFYTTYVRHLEMTTIVFAGALYGLFKVFFKYLLLLLLKNFDIRLQLLLVI